MLILSEGSSLTGNLIYTTDIFTEETAKRMAGHFKVPHPLFQACECGAAMLT